MSHKKSSKRSKTEKNNPQPLVLIPTDLVVEILKRLPAKSIARFLLVSKLWATIIRSKYFIRSFPSSSQPSRLLLAFNREDHQNNSHNWYFFSPSQNDQTILDFHSRAQFQVSPAPTMSTCEYVHGLISVVSGEDQVIINPSTGKSITLPRLKPNPIRKIVRRFFGYDPVDDQYKALCISTKKYQVLKLGSSSSRWRNIKCSAPHFPISNGLCMDGVVYYLALNRQRINELSLVSFEVRSEKLSFVITNSSLRRNMSLQICPSLIRYGAKLAVANHYVLELWVLEDAKKDEWSKISLFFHRWKDNKLGLRPPRIIGQVHTGEIALTCYNNNDGIHVIYYYDHKKNTQRRYLMQGNAGFGSPVCFVDYIESVMLL